MADGSSSSGMEGVVPVDLDKLLTALMQTFALVLLGAAANLYSFIPPGAGDTLGAYTAKFALPALIFRQIAKLHLALCDPMVLVGMLVAKLAVAVLVGAVTCCLSGGNGVGQRERSWSMAAIFAMLTTMQNDFALGLPILDALYPPDTHDDCDGTPTTCTHELNKSDYLYLFAPISVMIINPLCFAVLELSNSIARRKHSPDAAHERIGCWFICRQVLLPTISNPVVFCVGLGLLANGASAWTGKTLPPDDGAIDEALKTLGDSFSAMALFCLGMSMADDNKGEANAEDNSGCDDSETEEEAAGMSPSVRSVRLSIGDIRASAGVRSPEKGLGSSRWIAALLLVVAKSLLLPIVARTVVLLLTKNVELSQFVFVYATFPAAPSVYLFAARFRLRKRDLAHVSLTTLLGTLLAAPIMFVTAQMASIRLESETATHTVVKHFTEVLETAEDIGLASVFFSAWTLLVVTSMLFSRDAQGRGRSWRRQHVVWAVFFLSLTQLLYTGLNAACVPIKDTHTTLAKHCTLAIEGFAIGSRVWGVILVVAEIHLGHSNAAAEAGGIWMLLRAGKYVVLWVGWMLPSVWVGALFASGLWEKLDLNCWACFDESHGRLPTEPDPYVKHYRLATSGVSAGLALIAVGCLIWAQRQVADVDLAKPSRKRLGVEARQEAALKEALLGGRRPSEGIESTGPPVAVNAVEDVNQGVSVWQPLRLRAVGLCNLIGLLAQVAVGVATLLPASADGIMLEILALNHFCLFAQGIATGVMLGGFSTAPVVALVTRVIRQAGRWWNKTKGKYVAPERWSQWTPNTEPELS